MQTVPYLPDEIICYCFDYLKEDKDHYAVRMTCDKWNRCSQSVFITLANDLIKRLQSDIWFDPFIWIELEPECKGLLRFKFFELATDLLLFKLFDLEISFCDDFEIVSFILYSQDRIHISSYLENMFRKLTRARTHSGWLVSLATKLKYEYLNELYGYVCKKNQLLPSIRRDLFKTLEGRMGKKIVCPHCSFTLDNHNPKGTTVDKFYDCRRIVGNFSFNAF